MATPTRDANDLYRDCFFFSIGYIFKSALFSGIAVAGVGFMLHEFITNWGFVGFFIGSFKMGMALLLASFLEPCPEEHQKFGLVREYMAWYQKHHHQIASAA